MGKRSVSDSSKKVKKPSPSKSPGSAGKKRSKPGATLHYDYKGEKPMEMDMFARITGFATVINIDPGCTVDIDISAQSKAMTQVINIGPGSCINVMTSGETQHIAPTINIGGGSTMNVALDANIKGVADTINIGPLSIINIVTRPVDGRCYQGKLKDRSEAVRRWAAFIATAGMVDSAAPEPQEATANTDAVQEDSVASAADAHGGDHGNKVGKTGCETQ